jgi:long-chain acyl-CoA synthetase
LVSSVYSPIGRLIARRLRRTEHQPATWYVTRQGGVTTTDWKDLIVQVKRFALGLSALGLERGQVVGVVAVAAPETSIAILGCQLLGLTVADLGDGIESEELFDAIQRSNVNSVICGSREQAETLVPHVRQLCGERRLIGWGAASSVSAVMPFGQLCLKGAELLEREPVRANRLLTEAEGQDIALLLPQRRRKSETLPPPGMMIVEERERYGVRLTIDNCIAASQSYITALTISSQDRILRLGPDSGIVELCLLSVLALMSGASLVFDAGDLSRQQRAEVTHPTVILADADELDALYRDIDRELLVGSAWRRWLSTWARRVGNEAARRRVSGFENGLVLSCSLFVADQMVLSEYRRLLGGAVRRLVSRGARTRRSTRWFFEAIGLSPLGLLGLPESCGVGLIEPPEDPRPGSFGRAMPGVGVCVAGTGAVQIRGPFVADNAIERQASGWISLGITGEIDADGTVWPERTLGALDASSLAVLPIADHWDSKQ